MMSKTKEQIIRQVKYQKEDIIALQHRCKCLEEETIKLKQEINKLNENMYEMQETSTDNT